MKLFELYKQPIREDKEFTASIKLCESVIKLLEGLNDDGGFDFEPDPKFAGVKGITRDTGAGIQDRKAADHKKQNEKVNQTWMTLVSKLGKLDFQNAEKLKVGLIKLAKVAKKNNFKLTPSPEEVLG